MELYLYSFINGFISPQLFEEWIYNNLNLISKEISSQNLLLDLISCDYSSYDDIEHIKTLISKEYKNKFSNFNYNMVLNSNNLKLNAITKQSQEEKKNNNNNIIIVFDCTNINSSLRLQQEIQRKFNFPEWYGKNWDAFNDLLDLTETLEIRFINYDKMLKIIPNDSIHFVQILDKYKDKFNCKFNLIFDK